MWDNNQEYWNVHRIMIIPQVELNHFFKLQHEQKQSISKSENSHSGKYLFLQKPYINLRTIS